VDLQAKMNDANKASASYWAVGPGTEIPAGHWALLAAADGGSWIPYQEPGS
jgi:hypothetical protein